MIKIDYVTPDDYVIPDLIRDPLPREKIPGQARNDGFDQ